jgi:hypothetical protein
MYMYLETIFSCHLIQIILFLELGHERCDPGTYTIYNADNVVTIYDSQCKCIPNVYQNKTRRYISCNISNQKYKYISIKIM